MSREAAVRVAAEQLAARPATFRTTTLHTTQTGNHPADLAAIGVPAFELFSLDSGYRQWFERSEAQMPRVLHTSSWAPEEVELKAAGSVLDLRAAQTWLFGLPSREMVAGLTLDFEHPRGGLLPHPTPELFTDVDAGRDRLRVGGRSYIEVCRNGIFGTERLMLGADMHHLAFAPGLPANAPFDPDMLQRLVSRRDEPSRPEHLTARFPHEANRYHDQFLALTPGATAVGVSLATSSWRLCSPPFRRWPPYLGCARSSAARTGRLTNVGVPRTRVAPPGSRRVSESCEN